MALTRQGLVDQLTMFLQVRQALQLPGVPPGRVRVRLPPNRQGEGVPGGDLRSNSGYLLITPLSIHVN